MAHALATLGYNTIHGSWDVNEQIISNATEGRSLMTGLGYDAYADIPAISAFFHRVDRRYPRSKFIYTDRDLDSWIDSRRRHIDGHPKTRTWDWFDRTPAEWKQGKRAIEARIRKHFKGNDNLLWMNIFDGTGYPELCDFLGKPIPDKPFPHVK